MRKGRGRKRRPMKPRTLHCDLSDSELCDIASRARYVGSTEHKSYRSPAGEPSLRSDATPCDKEIEFPAIAALLSDSIRKGRISNAIEHGFPRYVWGWIDMDLYEARHINGYPGTYKGYKLEPPEYPKDRDKRLFGE